MLKPGQNDQYLPNAIWLYIKYLIQIFFHVDKKLALVQVMIVAGDDSLIESMRAEFTNAYNMLFWPDAHMLASHWSR